MAQNSTGVDINAAENLLKRVFGTEQPVLQFQSEAPRFKAMRKKPFGFGAGVYDSIQNSDIQSLGISNSGKAQSRAFNNDEKQAFSRRLMELIASVSRSHYQAQEFSIFNTSTYTGNYTGCAGVLSNTAYAGGGNPNNLNSYSLDTSIAGTRRYANLQGIFPGMKLDVYSSANWAKVATIQVMVVDEVALTFTGYQDNATPAALTTYFLFRAGNASNPGDFNRDVFGTGDAIDDGTNTATYLGLASAGYWKSFVLGNSGTLRDFVPQVMNEVQLRAQKRNNGNRKMQAWMCYGMEEMLLAYYQRTIVSTKGMGDTPFKVNLGGSPDEWGPAFTINTSPRMCPYEIHVFAADDFQIKEAVPFGPVNLGDGKDATPNFWARVIGKDNWEALMRQEYQQVNLTRNKGFKIADLNQNRNY